MKTVTEKDILDAFVALVEDNMTTTTNEVKEKLRNDGFWVLQDTVFDVITTHFENLGYERNYNGTYYTYNEIGGLDEDDEVEDQKVKRSKIISDIDMIDTDIYSIDILHDGDTYKLTVSDKPDLDSCYGFLSYKVKSKNNDNDNDWYLYASDTSIITRHKALYYVWKVISQEYDGFIAYADLRSKKLQ